MLISGKETFTLKDKAEGEKNRIQSFILFVEYKRIKIEKLDQRIWVTFIHVFVVKVQV